MAASSKGGKTMWKIRHNSLGGRNGKPSMSPGEAIRKLLDLQKNRDMEYAHLEADNILCELLDSLGYEEVVEAFHDIDKEY